MAKTFFLSRTTPGLFLTFSTECLNLDGDGIRTVDLWSRKHRLCQLRRNHWQTQNNGFTNSPIFGWDKKKPNVLNYFAGSYFAFITKKYSESAKIKNCSEKNIRRKSSFKLKNDNLQKNVNFYVLGHSSLDYPLIVWKRTCIKVMID